MSRIASDKGCCAIMVCSNADEACPAVPGAEDRISMPCDDPGTFDDTGQEMISCDESCRQIAREISYVFHPVKNSCQGEHGLDPTR